MTQRVWERLGLVEVPQRYSATADRAIDELGHAWRQTDSSVREEIDNWLTESQEAGDVDPATFMRYLAANVPDLRPAAINVRAAAIICGSVFLGRAAIAAPADGAVLGTANVSDGAVLGTANMSDGAPGTQSVPGSAAKKTPKTSPWRGVPMTYEDCGFRWFAGVAQELRE